MATDHHLWPTIGRKHLRCHTVAVNLVLDCFSHILPCCHSSPSATTSWRGRGDTRCLETMLSFHSDSMISRSLTQEVRGWFAGRQDAVNGHAHRAQRRANGDGLLLGSHEANREGGMQKLLAVAQRRLVHAGLQEDGVAGPGCDLLAIQRRGQIPRGLDRARILWQTFGQD